MVLLEPRCLQLYWLSTYIICLTVGDDENIRATIYTRNDHVFLINRKCSVYPFANPSSDSASGGMLTRNLLIKK